MYFFIVLVVPYSALTDYDRSVVLVLDDRPDPQLWGHCRSTHNSSMIQGSHGHGKSWKTMENKKIKSRPGKVMGNENLTKSHGKVMEF